MDSTDRRIVIIGLELGDGPLMHAWAEAGRLPTMKALIDQGCWGWLDTTADQLHISAWPCIYTGATPGEHGVYFTFQPAPGLQGYQRFHSGQYGRPTFWRLLDSAGHRCAVLDAPYTHPEEGYGGGYVNDWGTWAHYLAPGSLPPNLLRRLESACGSYPLGKEANDLGLAPLDATDTAARLIESIKAKTAATCWLMQDQDAEVLFTVYGETHVAGHYCWSADLQDADSRMHDSPMLSVYQELDRGIARIRQAAGDGATVIVVSGDCVGANHAGWHLLPEILKRLGHLMAPQAPGEESAAAPRSRGFDPVKALRDMLPKDFRKSLARRLPTKLRDKLAQRVDMAEVDWSRTRAYCLPTDLEGYIRVNLRGREPQGTVAPGAEFEQLMQDLTDALLELRDAGTKRPVVRDIIRPAQSFAGPMLDFLPDLVVRWDPAGPISSVTSPRTGVVTLPSPDPRTGTHTGPGFVVATGPGISAGSSLQHGHVLDFAPTLLARMGVTAPDHMHGRIWPELAASRQLSRSGTQ